MNTILLTHLVIFVKSQYHQGYKGGTILELLCHYYFNTFLFQFPIQSTTRTTILVTPGTLQRRLTRHRRRKRHTRRSAIRRKTVSPVTAGSRRPESRHTEGQSVNQKQWALLNGIDVINQFISYSGSQTGGRDLFQGRQIFLRVAKVQERPIYHLWFCPEVNIKTVPGQLLYLLQFL